jgi:hypothetical protein
VKLVGGGREGTQRVRENLQKRAAHTADIHTLYTTENDVFTKKLYYDSSYYYYARAISHGFPSVLKCKDYLGEALRSAESARHRHGNREGRRIRHDAI